MHQRCLRHAGREAAARCPSCRRYFCRECVTEHEGKVTCADCLAKLLQTVDAKPSYSLEWALLSVGGFLLAWVLFYYLGSFLGNAPASFHGA